MVGIVSYSAYIPQYRLPLNAIAEAWEKDSREVVQGLGVQTKAVPAKDEDAVTMACSAAQEALSLTPLERSRIGVLFVGSESHPYAVNPTSTIVGELLGIGNNYLAADLEFACKAGTAGLRAAMGIVGNGEVDLGMAIGTDVAQSRPHDVLEYTSGAGAVAIVVGNKKQPLLATLVDATSYSSDTPDFWRRDGIRYPSHAGRFTGEPAYFHHVLSSTKLLLAKTKKDPSEITWAVFHSPNGKFPREVSKRLGFTTEQMRHSLLVDTIGNPYSASSLISFANVLDHARPGDTILLVSYGSGAGSDAFLWKVTSKITAFQKRREARHTSIRQLLETTETISYVSYLKQTHKIP